MVATDSTELVKMLALDSRMTALQLALLSSLAVCISANVPHETPLPTDDLTVAPTLSPLVTTSDQLQWKPKTAYDAPNDVTWENLSFPTTTAPSSEHESQSVKRYAVATFDFHHVATPYIISLWIIIVGLAKIGQSSCARRRLHDTHLSSLSLHSKN